MDSASIIETLQSLVPGASYESAASVEHPAIYVPVDRLVESLNLIADSNLKPGN